MQKEQAVEVLIQVANLAQKSGLLKLEEAVTVVQAINTLMQKEEVNQKDTAKNQK